MNESILTETRTELAPRRPRKSRRRTQPVVVIAILIEECQSSAEQFVTNYCIAAVVTDNQMSCFHW